LFEKKETSIITSGLGQTKVQVASLN